MILTVDGKTVENINKILKLYIAAMYFSNCEQCCELLA